MWGRSALRSFQCKINSHNHSNFRVGVNWRSNVAPFSSEATANKRNSVVKVRTGIVGLPVIKDGRELLIQLYKKLLKKVETLPETDILRVEQTFLINERLRILESDEDLQTIEKKLNIDGPRELQVEELIQEVENDLKVLPLYTEMLEEEADPDAEIPVVILTGQQLEWTETLRNNFWKYQKSSRVIKAYINGETEVYANSADQTYPKEGKFAQKRF